MLPRAKCRFLQNRIYRILNPVILHRITGFFHSTEICISHLFPTENYSKRHECAPVFRQPRLFLYKPKTSYRCRSPPSDFDFANQLNLKIEIGGFNHEENQFEGVLPFL